LSVISCQWLRAAISPMRPASIHENPLLIVSIADFKERNMYKTTIKMVRSVIFLSTILLLLVACVAPVAQAPTAETASSEAAELPVVGMMKIVSHPALDAEQQGVKDALAAAGFVDGESVVIQEANAEGDISTLTTIAQKFVDDGVDLIVTTSTPALQAAFNATKDLEGPPIVFNAVTSPYAAGIANAADDHPSWVIGIQALAPVEDALALIPRLLPDVQTVGYIYNPAEANSVVNTEIAEPAAETLGLTLEITQISNSSEVQAAAEALVARGVQAFFVSTDSTVVASLEALIKVANDNDIPLFANDPSSAERGAAVALGLDYYQDGLDTGALAVGILNGELDIAATPIERQRKGSLAINMSAAAEQGLTIPDDLKAEAATIFGE
ncbi:MAG TPA: ABC transporter substrate-binding protein, partial [Caldilineaceae bacterium]|nr:ABC transporter substrate-binding protein [Caldilineaceae bacterium]